MCMILQSHPDHPTLLVTAEKRSDGGVKWRAEEGGATAPGPRSREALIHHKIQNKNHHRKDIFQFIHEKFTISLSEMGKMHSFGSLNLEIFQRGKVAKTLQWQCVDVLAGGPLAGVAPGPTKVLHDTGGVSGDRVRVGVDHALRP